LPILKAGSAAELKCPELKQADLLSETASTSENLRLLCRTHNQYRILNLPGTIRGLTPGKF